MLDFRDQARDGEGSGAEETLAAQRLMLQAVIEFLFKRDGHGGLRHVPS